MKDNLSASGFLTVLEVAKELDLSADEVKDLIKTDQLKATKDMIIPRSSLRAYKDNDQVADIFNSVTSQAAVSLNKARKDFIQDNNKTPEEWLAAWAREEIKDSAENMSISIHAKAIVFETNV